MLYYSTNDCSIKKTFTGIIILLLLCTVLKAQEEFVPPQAKLITRFPFTQLSGGIIIVKARIDDIPDSLNFVLDTGSGGISLDSTTVAELKLTRSKSDRTIRGIAGMKLVDFALKHTLRLPGLDVPNLDFHINDYELLTSVYGVRIDGIIGFSFLKRFIVKINYDSLKIDVLTNGTIKYPRGGYLLKPQLSALPFQQASVEDDRAIDSRFIFDTGAGLCMLLSEDFVTDSLLLKKNRKRFASQAEGLGGKKLMDISVIRQFRLGPYKFRKMPVYIFRDDYNVTSYPTLGGIIGNDILRRFNVILNYAEQSIHIKPNTHFIDPFDYSYTGLGIYQVENDITVIDVIEGSPGEKAGFKAGDIIFAMDKNFTKNIQVFKTLLQTAGNKVKVVVMRNGQPVELKLHVRNILRG